MVDKTTPNISDFALERNTIKYLGNQFRQIFLETKISREKPFIFSIFIDHTKKGNIVFGVVDRLVQKNKNTSYNSGNAVCYYGGNGGMDGFN
jgi:hypothetical protein